MANQRVNIEEELQAWADTFLALVELQKELVAVSQDMTFADDWSWMVPFRNLVSDVWGQIADTAPEDRIRVAKEWQQKAVKAIDAILEREL